MSSCLKLSDALDGALPSGVASDADAGFISSLSSDDVLDVLRTVTTPFDGRVGVPRQSHCTDSCGNGCQRRSSDDEHGSCPEVAPAGYSPCLLMTRPQSVALPSRSVTILANRALMAALTEVLVIVVLKVVTCPAVA